MVRSTIELDLDALRGTGKHKGRKRIGYAKLGRSISFDPRKFGYAGDAEAPQLLTRLARRNPDVDWLVFGRNDGGLDLGLPNIINPWASRQVGPAIGLAEKLSVGMGTLDGVVAHTGQTGTSHQCIPQSKNTWAEYYKDPWSNGTTPQDWGATYAGFLIKGLNILGDNTDGRAPVVWVCTDPRNYIKARDIKWPTGSWDVLAQYTFTREQRHERFKDVRTPQDLEWPEIYNATQDRDDRSIWSVRHGYRHAGLELMILPDDWETWGAADFDDRAPAGVATTSFAVDKAEREPPRSKLVRDWFMPVWPGADVLGKWDKESLTHVPPGTVRETKPEEFAGLLNRWRTTIALPALGSSWTTAKPYQCWAARIVTFMLGRNDGQGFTLPTRRHEAGTEQVAEINGRPLYSIRNDWTEQDLALASWLRVETPEEFEKASKAAAYDEGIWTWITNAQRDLLQRRWNETQLENEIERKLGL